MNEDLISIIVPVYNASKYLPQCIESILNQTHKNIELILVNDGSTDDSEAICLDYAGRDDRIVYTKQENGGAASARNRGLDICKGNYIGFVDSDDYIDTDMYETLFSAIDENGADVSQILSRRVTDNGDILNDELIQKTECLPSECFTNDEAIERYLRGNHSLCTHLYSSALFRDVRMPENMSGEDLAIIIPFYRNCKQVVKVSKYKYNYRYNASSVTNSPLNQRRINLFYEFERQLDEYGDNAFYKNILVFCISKCLSSIINTMLLSGEGTFDNNEEYFRNKLKKYLHDIKNNEYVKENQIKKHSLYLKCRPIFKLLLLVKRKYFYKRRLYGEE